MSEAKNTALLLLGHGSSKHPDSSRSVRLHTELLREQVNSTEAFSEVRCAFLKEPPLIDEALEELKSTHVTIVPDFLAEGYFTRQVIPAKLKKKLGDSSDGFVYCPPVGTHPLMAELLLDVAQNLLGDWCADETSLLVIGHGSGKNPCSKQTLQHHLHTIREQNTFAQVADLWLEEDPLVGDWQRETVQDQVLIIPFLLNDGQHGGWDIPSEIGLSPGGRIHGETHEIEGKRVRIAPALGTSPRFVEAIVALAMLWGQ